MKNVLCSGLTLLAAGLLSPALQAAEPPSAQFAAFNDWIGSDLKGLRMGADGRVQLAPSLRRLAQIPEGVVWCVVEDGAGGLYLSAGSEGRIFHYSNGQVKPFAQVKGGVVFAMTRLGQDLIVAPTGEGKLLRVSSTGDIKPYAEIEARLVWALERQGSEILVAGGGEKGAMLLLARESYSRKLAELPEETAFTCMVSDQKGGWFLGTHGRGLLVKFAGLQAGDRVETLYSTGFEEVRSLIFSDDQLYAGLTNGLSNRMATGNLERREGYLAEPGKQTRGAVIRLDKKRIPETLWQSNDAQLFSLTLWKDQLLLGTGNRSRIFGIPMKDELRKLEPFRVVQDLGSGQATQFFAMGSDLGVVGSNPGEIHTLSELQATEGTLESRLLVGHPVANWGRAYVESTTPSGTSVTLQYRVGSTETPDSTWSPWTPPLKSGERPSLASARYAQFRLRLASTRGGATPTVESVRLHWSNQNLPPAWEDIQVMPSGLVLTRNTPPDEIGLERIPLSTQKLIPALGTRGSERRSFRQGSQAFMFKINDPNEDTLEFAIRLVPEQGNPIELEKAWTERYFTFDTLPIPDGRYRLEATASDAPSQPYNLSQTALWRTAAFTIDHTPPQLLETGANLEGENVRLRFLAKDERSVVKEAMVSVDGQNWLQLAPEDQVFDAVDERFEAVIPRKRIQGDRVLIKVADACNNEQSAFVKF